MPYIACLLPCSPGYAAADEEARGRPSDAPEGYTSYFGLVVDPFVKESKDTSLVPVPPSPSAVYFRGDELPRPPNLLYSVSLRSSAALFPALIIIRRAMERAIVLEALIYVS